MDGLPHGGVAAAELVGDLLHRASIDDVPLVQPAAVFETNLEPLAVPDPGVEPVLAGDLDLISSPQWGDDFITGLTAGRVVHFTGLSTQPTSGPPSTASTCARQLRDAFLAEPTNPLDQACVATAHGPSFTLT